MCHSQRHTYTRTQRRTKRSAPSACINVNERTVKISFILFRLLHSSRFWRAYLCAPPVCIASRPGCGVASTSIVVKQISLCCCYSQFIVAFLNRPTWTNQKGKEIFSLKIIFHRTHSVPAQQKYVDAFFFLFSLLNRRRWSWLRQLFAIFMLRGMDYCPFVVYIKRTWKWVLILRLLREF